jgi:hypothetical protein
VHDDEPKAKCGHSQRFFSVVERLMLCSVVSAELSEENRLILILMILHEIEGLLMRPVTRITVECLRVYSSVEFSGSDELLTKDHETSSFVTYFFKITKPPFLKT